VWRVARGSGSLTSTDVRAQDGRVPGGRGLATRAKLLKSTHELLEERSYRDLATADIARQAGTSPATFYQYFADVESAVLVLAEQMAAEHTELSLIVRDADWRKPAASARAADALATTFLAFWQQHRSILRVVDLASAEGDGRFRALRTTLLNDVTNALAEAVRAVRAHGHQSTPAGPTDPMAVAAVLVSMLAHVAAHAEGLGNWGIAPADTQIVMADIVHQSVTGRRIARP
jgi:AcrR family transcriptional regulator